VASVRFVRFYDRSVSWYPPLDVHVVTPRVELRAATDDLLGLLAPLVASGRAMADPPPWDDPCSFYESDPDVRVRSWLQAIWRGRGTVRPDSWRLYFVVFVDGEPIGQQDVTGDEFDMFGTVETTSWVTSDARGSGIGTEMRSAVLHLAFEGLGAAEARSEAAVDNAASNRISERLGYTRNGTSWATHQGKPVLGQRWLLDRKTWEARRRDDITLSGVEACRATLGLDAPGLT
jgi:RimJ/RimL family protein N-acetyltransferase